MIRNYKSTAHSKKLSVHIQFSIFVVFAKVKWQHWIYLSRFVKTMLFFVENVIAYKFCFGVFHPSILVVLNLLWLLAPSRYLSTTVAPCSAIDFLLNIKEKILILQLTFCDFIKTSIIVFFFEYCGGTSSMEE